MLNTVFLVSLWSSLAGRVSALAVQYSRRSCRNIEKAALEKYWEPYAGAAERLQQVKGGHVNIEDKHLIEWMLEIMDIVAECSGPPPPLWRTASSSAKREEKAQAEVSSYSRRMSPEIMKRRLAAPTGSPPARMRALSGQRTMGVAIAARRQLSGGPRSSSSVMVAATATRVEKQEVNSSALVAPLPLLAGADSRSPSRSPATSRSPSPTKKVRAWTPGPSKTISPGESSPGTAGQLLVPLKDGGKRPAMPSGLGFVDLPDPSLRTLSFISARPQPPPADPLKRESTPTQKQEQAAAEFNEDLKQKTSDAKLDAMSAKLDAMMKAKESKEKKVYSPKFPGNSARIF